MRRMLAITTAAGAIAFSSAAFAVPQWCIDIGGPPCEGGPGGGEEAAGNNLSYPMKFVPGLGESDQPALRTICTGGSVEPAVDADGNTVAPTFPPEEPVYWVQKTEAIWTAECTEATTANVSAKWGDNLVGENSPKAGKPIRVEVNLTDFDDSTLRTGYVVLKLTDELDRLATYGTNGTELNTPYRVFDSGARLSIERCTDAECTGVESDPIYSGPISAEVNSTGNIVYGYNWGTTRTDAAEKGTYLLSFFSKSTRIVSNEDARATLCVDEDGAPKCTQVIVPVGAGGGGGGGGNNPNRP